MSPQELLRAYDLELRRSAPYFDDAVRLETDGSVVRLLGATADPGNNCVLYSDLDETTADAAVDRQVAYFAGLGRGFEWKLHEHDRPAGLRKLLLSKGFEPAGDEVIVALDLAKPRLPIHLPDGWRAGPWPESESLEALMVIQKEVWRGEELDWLAESLARERASRPDAIRFHAVWADARPISVGWTRLHGRFASLFGGSTLADFRGKGAYRALLASRLDEAARLGAKTALVDAGPMSRPILERQGFLRLTGTTPMLKRYKK